MAEEKTARTPVEHPEHGETEGNLSAAASHVDAGARQALAGSGLDREGPSFATAALIGVGVALIEPELIPGMLIGAGAWAAPKLLPALGSMLRPMVKGVVKAGYSATMAMREMAAEATEHVEDIVAEARAEHEAGHATNGHEAHPAEATAETGKRQRRHPRTPPVPATNL